MEDNIIYEWIVPDDYEPTPHEDIAKAYRVYANPLAASGIIVYGLWQGTWEANPWNLRPLIKTLINQLKEKEDAPQPDGEKDGDKPCSAQNCEAVIGGAVCDTCEHL